MKCMYIVPSKHFPLLPIKNKINNKYHVICQLYSIQLQNGVKSNLKQPSLKIKFAGPKNSVGKGCEIRSGSQEMAVMVG